MPTYDLLINGVSVDCLLDSLDLQMTANGIDTLSADLDYDVMASPSTPPAAIDAAVAFQINGVTKWGGIITQQPQEALAGPNIDTRVLRISASSYDVLPSFQYITATFPAGSLLDFLTAFVPYLSSYGITLDPSQATGPALEEIVATRMRADELLNLVNTMTGAVGDPWPWEVSATKELSMFAPGSRVAPFDVLDTGPVMQVGDVRVTETRDDTYANRIILVISGAGPATSTEYFVAADGVTVGGFIYFTTKYPASTSINDAWPNELYFNSTAMGPIGRIGPNPGDVVTNAWDWDPANHRLRYTIASGAAFPTTEQITVTYAIAYPFELIVEDIPAQAPPIGIRARVINVPQGMSLAAATDMANGILARKKRTVTQADYASYDDGLRPGQAQTIALAKLSVSGSFLINQVNARIEPGANLLRYEVTALEGAVVQGDFRQTPKDWLIDNSGGGAARTGIAMGGVPNPPDRSVQFDWQGRFKSTPDVLIDWDNSGDVYGVEIAPARFAVVTDDDGTLGLTPHVVFALANRFAGLDKALSFWQINNALPGGAGCDWEIESASAINISSNEDLELAGVNVVVTASPATAGNFVGLGKLVGMDTIALGGTRHTTSFTLDASLSGAGGESLLLLDSSTPRTLTLPVSSGTTVSLGLGGQYGRMVFAKNIGSAAWTITPASGTIEGVASISVATGEGAIIFGSINTGAGWHVIGGVGSIIAGGSGPGSGDVVGPSSSVDSEFALFDSTTGKLLKRATGTGLAYATSGVYSVVTLGSDLSLSGGVLSTQAGIQTVTATLTDADILTLPSVPYLLVAAPAPGFWINVHRATYIKKSGGGAYTGISTTAATLVIQNLGGSWMTTTISNDSLLTIPLTRLTDFLGGANEKLAQVTGPYLEAVQSGGGAGDWGYLQPGVGSALADYDAKGVYLALDNNGSPTDLGGGDPANTLTVTMFYTVEPT